MQKLTNSRRACFSMCHRRHYYAYELSRRPVIESEALSYGSLAHKALEQWWWSPTDRLRDALSILQVAPCRDEYMRHSVMAVMRGYHARWSEAQKTIETIEVEKEYSVPLLNPDSGARSRTWTLDGKIDAIAEIAPKHEIIVEHKTTSSDIGPTSRYWDKLAFNGQVSGYFYGAQSIGHDVQECMYDVIRKPDIRPYKATPEADRKYTKEGKLYANQRLADETPEEFGQRTLDVVMADPDRYYQRRSVGRRDEDLITYMEDMWAIGRELADAQADKRWPRNPSACESWSGCEYFDVCAGYVDIHSERFRTTLVNPELEASC